jgi:signal transduction histidine kinase
VRRSRRTARLRLALLFALLFLVSGTLVEGVTYLLVSGGPSVHTAVQSVNDNTGTVTIVPDGPVLEQHNADVARVLADSWIVLVLTTLASIPLGWVLAGRVLRPVRTITEGARKISAGNLHERLALSGPNDEFKRLGDTLDELLARLEASFDAQRRFVANASHELRTPLALERTLLQVALADPNVDVPTLRATCEEVLETGADQERLLEALLTLASSERGLERREPVELDRLVARELERPRGEVESLGLRVASELSSAIVLGDVALLERLVANLLDNAVGHNVAHGHVEVTTGTEDGGAVVLSVANGGPLIAPEDTERLLEPFQRLEPGRAGNDDGHHGLGLSIVRAVAAAHGAELDVRARPGGGLVVTVKFLLGTPGAGSAPA